jgi:glycoprotein-N-acetylgalactosamine 3-beta-galactosyltransferase
MGLEGKDSNGNSWPPSLASIDDLCEPIGNIGGRKDHNKNLLDAVPIVVHSTTNAEPTIFCGVYTMQTAHATNIRAMRETWAPHCHGFLAFSTQSDPRIPAISLPHDGPETYTNMWQ